MTDREKRIATATNMFVSGYNCAQSTAVSFCDLVAADETILIKASAAFGGGVVRLREVCGVVSGMMIVFGLSQDDFTDFSIKEEKAKFYEGGQELIARFSALNKTINCGELLEVFDKNPLPEDRTGEYYKEHPCLKLVEDGVNILCDYFGME